MFEWFCEPAEGACVDFPHSIFCYIFIFNEYIPIICTLLFLQRPEILF